MQENLPKDAKSAIAGYKFRFAPLNENGMSNKGNWTGVWPESGKVTDTSTLIGFMTAGYPHTVEFFKPDANMDTDKPEFVVEFVISVPNIKIDVCMAPSFDELVGAYEDGTMTISDIFVSDEFRAAMASTGDKSDNELGCDLSEMIPSLEAAIGEEKEVPFYIDKTGENAGTMRLGEGDEDLVFTVTYNPLSGILTTYYEDEGVSLGGSLQAKYNADRTGVEVKGDMTTDLGMGSENINLTIAFKGSKPLTAAES